MENNDNSIEIISKENTLPKSQNIDFVSEKSNELITKQGEMELPQQLDHTKSATTDQNGALSDKDSDDEIFSKPSKMRLSIVDSDSESVDKVQGDYTKRFLNDSDDNLNENKSKINQNEVDDQGGGKSEPKLGKSRLEILDSDSSDNENSNGEKSSNLREFRDPLISDDEHEAKSPKCETKTNLAALCDSESSDDELPKHSPPFKSRITDDDAPKSQFSNLCDPDTENENSDEDSSITLKKSRGKNSRKINTDKSKVMTGKEALEQRKEIISESQRMTRESYISLPYHHSKSHSLQEFLSKRKKVSDLIKTTQIPITSLKLSAKQIEIAAIKLEEREKTLDEFYNSNSESEHEGEVDETNGSKTMENNEKNLDPDLDDGGEQNLEKTDTKACLTEIQNILGEENEPQVIEEPQSDESELRQEANSVESSRKNVPDPIVETQSNLSTFEEKEACKDDLIDNLESNLKEPTENVSSKTEDMTETPKPLKPTKLSILEKLKKYNPNFDLKVNFKPKITKDSEVVILDDDLSEKSKAIDDLKKRFFKHNKMKPVHTNDEKEIEKIDTSILKHEIAKVLIDHDDLDRFIEHKPGVKLKKLREELAVQMAKKRLESWEKQRQEVDELTKLDEESEACTKDIDEIDNALEEEEMTDSSSSSESEPEENDIILKDKPQKKSDFVDFEVEVSSNEDSSSDDEDSDENNDETNTSQTENKKLKRIIVHNSDDDFSDTENNLDLKKSLKDIINNLSDESNPTQKTDDTKDNIQNLQDTISLNSDEEIPLYQHENLNKTPLKTQTKSQFNFTPISFLTGLQSKTDLLESPSITLTEPSPIRSSSTVKTNLFESGNINLTQAFDELENLCSGKFTEKKIDDIESQNNQKDVNNFEFDDSEDFKLVFDENLIDDSQKDGEKIPDESLTNVEKTNLNTENRNGKLVLLSSDDENGNQDMFEEKSCKRKKRKKRKLGFSDDEMSSSESEIEETEENTNEEENPNVDYDSEENEIENITENNDVDFDENEEIVPTKIAQNFFENEAELSESEWGSEDENETGLDQFEIDEADFENYNENKLQKELGKIHMRQVLDQDSREVRLLQEMLLEDGELYGASREKKFKWKNADSINWNDVGNPQNDENDLEFEDIESELEWRKQRHERETFIQEQRKKILQSQNEIEIIASDCQILQIGKNIIEKSSQDNSQKENKDDSKKTLDNFSFLNQKSYRGSFLARSEISLSRLSELTKNSKDVVLGPNLKNNRNFLFTSVEKSDDGDVEHGESKKRKADDSKGTPKVLKKMRVAENSPGTPKAKKGLSKLLK